MLALLAYINQRKKRKEMLEFIVQNKINSCDIFYKSQLQSGMLTESWRDWLSLTVLKMESDPPWTPDAPNDLIMGWHT